MSPGEAVAFAVFGWPGALSALALTAAALAAGRWRWAIVGAAVGLPFAAYLGMNPGGAPLGLAFGGGLIGAALAARTGRPRGGWWAWGLAVGVAAWLGGSVLSANLGATP